MIPRTPTLYIFSGPSGSGKSTLAKELAKKIHATFVRIDTIEQALKDVCQYTLQGGEGYQLGHLIARENLKLGNDVIADSVNPWELTRAAWNEVATSSGAKFVNIEIICSDQIEHQKRVENRSIEIENLDPTTWQDVLNRDYHKWSGTRILIDTAHEEIHQSFDRLIHLIR